MKKRLEQLSTKWEIEADRIKSMSEDVTHPKSHRVVFNHFLIQLLKCIGEAKVELRTTTSEIYSDKPLTQCMIGRDAECNHPKCPVSDEDEKNGKYCTLPLYDYRE